MDEKATSFGSALREQLNAVQERKQLLKQQLRAAEVEEQTLERCLAEWDDHFQGGRDSNRRQSQGFIQIKPEPHPDRDILSPKQLMRRLEDAIDQRPGILSSELADRFEPRIRPWVDTKSPRKLITDKLHELTRSKKISRDDEGRCWPQAP
ncbi:MAG: hypothetical protein Tsb0013_05690 [Phycisphaerales bacterium]